jgi:NAD(P)-dependent dehydrogenase (short-subunit alcohol dehydrogenase family)
MGWTPSKGDIMPTLFITGANRGLGFEFTRQYAADGWKVIACCRSPKKASALQALAQAHAAVHIQTLDVNDNKNIGELAAKLKRTPIDLLINCAGIFSGAGSYLSSVSADKTQSFGSIDPEAWMRVLRTNTIAPVMIAQAFQKNFSMGEGRMLIMISSGMGSIERANRPGDIAYRTSKAALNAATKNVSLSLRDQKITVVCFHPGWVQTDMGGKEADLTPEQSASHMRHTIANLKLKSSGQFFNYDGQIIPW